MKKFNIIIPTIVNGVEVTEAEALAFAEKEGCAIEYAYKTLAFKKAYDIVSEGQWDDIDSYDIEEV